MVSGAEAPAGAIVILADLARGNGTEVSLQNVCAHVRNGVEFAKNEPEVARAADEVCRLAAQLAAEARLSAQPIRQGAYPPALQHATQAVERFRAAVVRSREQRPSAASRA